MNHYKETPISPKKILAAIVAKPGCKFVDRVFDPRQRDRISQSASLLPGVLTPENFAQFQAEARRVEVLFTCWGMPVDFVTKAENFPALRAVLYSGGSVKSFAAPLLQRGVQVMGARVANAVAVAHFCLGQILLSCKGFFLNTTQYHRNNGDKNAPKPFTGAGVYGESITLLGMGAVARELVGLLKGLDLKILVVDPYLTAQEAAELGVERVTLAEGFAQGYVISNHLPNLPELHGVIDEPLLASMRSHATFINTGRGAEVNEAALLNVARQRRDLTFLLDVTAPEPPVPGSPLFQEENIWITSHIAGALNDEVRRMGDFVVTEFEKYARGEPLRFADTLEMLNRLA